MSCTDCCNKPPVILIDRLPLPGDDPCGTSGVTVCPGQLVYSQFSDPDICDRLFVRLLGTCNVMSFLEIPLVNCIEDTVDPVDGVDCCPQNTIWHNTSTGLYFISVNCNDDCNWLGLSDSGFGAEILSVQQYVEAGELLYPDLASIPVTTQTNLLPLSVGITNPSADRNMNVYIHFNGYDSALALLTSNPTLNFNYAFQPNFHIDAVLLNDPFRTDAHHWVSQLDSDLYGLNYRTGSWQSIRTLAPGASLTASCHMDLLITTPHDADISGFLSTGNGSIALIGSLV